jgi:hypothetical protein
MLLYHITMKRDGHQVQEVFDDHILSAILLFLFMLQLLNIEMNKTYC